MYHKYCMWAQNARAWHFNIFIPDISCEQRFIHNSLLFCFALINLYVGLILLLWHLYFTSLCPEPVIYSCHHSNSPRIAYSPTPSKYTHCDQFVSTLVRTNQYGELYCLLTIPVYLTTEFLCLVFKFKCLCCQPSYIHKMRASIATPSSDVMLHTIITVLTMTVYNQFIKSLMKLWTPINITSNYLFPTPKNWLWKVCSPLWNSGER